MLLTKILQMHSDLVHSTRQGFTVYYAIFSNLWQLLKSRFAILAVFRDLANSNLIANYFNRLIALNSVTKNDKENVTIELNKL